MNDTKGRRWPEDFETTTYRGPQQYPVPEDWVLSMVEMDGVMWDRYPELDINQEIVDDPKFDRKQTYEAECESASLWSEWNPGMNLTTHTLNIDGEDVFKVTGVDDEVLWRSVARALAQYARGEEVDVDPDGVAIEAKVAKNASLSDFCG